MHHTALLLSAALFCLLAHGSTHAQGTLEPRSAPAPSMVSLQQIWDKISTLESTVDTQSSTIISLESTVTSQQQQLLQLTSILDTQTKIVAATSANQDGLWQYIATGIRADDLSDIAYFPDGRLALLTTDRDHSNVEFHVRNGTGWDTTTVLDRVENPWFKFLITPGGQVNLAFVKSDPDDGLYMTTRSSAGTWGNPGSFGPRMPSGNIWIDSATGSGNRAAYTFVGESTERIRIMWINSFNFHDEIVIESADFSGPVVFEAPSVAFNPTTGYPAVAYQAVTGHPGEEAATVRYAEFDGTSWNDQRVDRRVNDYVDDGRRHPKLAFCPLTGRPSIFFRIPPNDPAIPRDFATLATRTTSSSWQHEEFLGHHLWRNPSTVSERHIETHLFDLLDDGTAVMGFLRRTEFHDPARMKKTEYIIAMFGADGSQRYSTAVGIDGPTFITAFRSAISPDNRITVAFTGNTTQINLAVSRLPIMP